MMSSNKTGEADRIFLMLKMETFEGSQRDETLAIKILGEVIDHLEDIPYYLVGGTLLGYIRYGNMMAWDDDHDIVMEKNHVTQIKPKLESIGFGGWWNHEGNYANLPLLQMCKEGIRVDIFSYIQEGDKISTNIGYFRNEDIYPTRKVQLHHLNVQIPARPFVILDRGIHNWRTHVVKRIKLLKNYCTTEPWVGNLYANEDGSIYNKA